MKLGIFSWITHIPGSKILWSKLKPAILRLRYAYKNKIIYFNNRWNGDGHLNKDIIGENNYIEVNKNVKFNRTFLKIRGNNNTVIIAENCVFGPDCLLSIEGNKCSIIIGASSWFTSKCCFFVQEDNQSISIGRDSMLANDIIIRTSDAHPIYDLDSQIRLNPPMNVGIGNSVWIAPNTKILKGSIIPDGCIIGSDTTVTKQFSEQNCLILGRPAKVVKHNIRWTKESLFPI